MTTRLVNRVGRRGAALLFFALLDLVYCFALARPPRPLTEPYRWPQTLLPLWVWACCWGTVGVLCLVYAFLPRDTVAFTAAASLKVLWGLLSLFGWVSGAVDRGWVSAVIWLGFALFIFLIAGGIPAPEVGRRGRAWTRY
jgi:hypothetical protein